MNKLFKEITKEFDKALKRFGEYTYRDKGSFEIMNVDSIAKRINNQYVASNDSEGLIVLLKSIGDYKDGLGDRLLEEILYFLCEEYDPDEERYGFIFEDDRMPDGY